MKDNGRIHDRAEGREKDYGNRALRIGHSSRDTIRGPKGTVWMSLVWTNFYLSDSLPIRGSRGVGRDAVASNDSFFPFFVREDTYEYIVSYIIYIYVQSNLNYFSHTLISSYSILELSHLVRDTDSRVSRHRVIVVGDATALRKKYLKVCLWDIKFMGCKVYLQK